MNKLAILFAIIFRLSIISLILTTAIYSYNSYNILVNIDYRTRLMARTQHTECIAMHKATQQMIAGRLKDLTLKRYKVID